MINNSAADCSIIAQVWHRVRTCDTRSTTNAQGQRVKGQGHSVT